MDFLPVPTGILREIDFSTAAIISTMQHLKIIYCQRFTQHYLKIVDYASGLPSHSSSYNSLRDGLLVFFFPARDNFCFMHTIIKGFDHRLLRPCGVYKMRSKSARWQIYCVMMFLMTYVSSTRPVVVFRGGRNVWIRDFSQCTRIGSDMLHDEYCLV